MTDPIHIDPEVMRTVANQHDDVADHQVLRGRADEAWR